MFFRRLIAALSIVTSCDHSAPGGDPRAPPASVEAEPDDASVPGELGQEGDEAELPPSRGPIGDGSPRALLSEIDRELGRMKSGTYVHRTSIDEAGGRFDFDCSGFAGYALNGAAPTAWEELRAASPGHLARPLAKHFERFFESLSPGAARGHWQRVGRVSDLEPGDVVAWLRPADVSSKSTGHVVIVRGRVVPDANRAFLVPVADSTSCSTGAAIRGNPQKRQGWAPGR
jgi:hypothetical protein